MVDVQGISQQKTLPKEALDALPTARSFATLGTTLPGVTANQRDVGGTQGERGNVLAAHGGAPMDMTLQIDGITIGTLGTSNSGGAWSNFSLNDAASQEISFETGAISAEAATGGVRVNVVPREGGNRFSGSLFGNFAKRGMSMSNFTPELQARGLRSPAGFDSLMDESGGFGGPIKRDRMWFFFAHRYRGNDLIGTDSFFSTDPLAIVYTPDLSRPLHSGGWDLDNQLRVTAQVTPRNKVSGFYDRVNKCNCPTVAVTPTITGESATQLTYPGTYLASVSWQAPISSKLLWDASFSHNVQESQFSPLYEGVTTTGPISVREASTGRTLRAPFTAFGGYQGQNNTRGTLSYVTGSHTTKVGFLLHTGSSDAPTDAFSNSIQYNLLSAVPTSVALTTAPYRSRFDVNSDLGIYAQDKWTLRRLTMTGSIRFDYLNMGIPAESAPAGRWVGARDFAAVSDVPNWKDISPRAGVSYDLFGNGKTAIKATVSRYVSGQVFTFPNAADPFVTSVNTATRPWTDGLNGNPKDFIPQGDPTNPLPNGEFTGTLSNLNFGKSIITTRYDPDLSQGWGKRPYNWEYSASVQQELLPRVSMEVGYFRRTFGNQTVTDNLDVTPADFDQYCITAPTDTRLGDVSATRICGLYDVKVAKAGVASNQIITFAKNYAGDVGQTYNGVDVNVNARPTGRLFLQAGVSTGRTVTKNCAQVDSPQTLRFCEVRQPFLASYRVSGGYTFPWQLQVSGVLQSIPPDPVTSIATLPVTGATAAASLGRPATFATANVSLVDPSTYTAFGERTNQLDLRVSKGVRIGRYRVEAIADFYNAFNVAPVLTYTTTYGLPAVNAWLAPASILQSGYLKLGGRFTF